MTYNLLGHVLADVLQHRKHDLARQRLADAGWVASHWHRVCSSALQSLKSDDLGGGFTASSFLTFLLDSEVALVGGFAALSLALVGALDGVDAL